MKLSDFSINALRQIITGDLPITPYKSGPNLIDLFNQFGSRDVYDWHGGGLPGALSRNDYVVAKLKELNGSRAVSEILLLLADERYYTEMENPNVDEVVNKINGVIKHDGYRIDTTGDVPVMVGEELPDEIEVEVHFEQIQQQILDTLDRARFSIWIAVAWFTNKTIFQKLVDKKAQGLNIQIVVLDDEINTKYGPNYEEHFETIRYPKKGRFENLMHNKFCIVDHRTVIHGSYNWTGKANYNKETVSIEASKELAEKYAEEFMKLKKG